MSEEHLARGPDFAAGWDAAMERVRAILAEGRKYDVLPAAAAMIETGLLDLEAAAAVMRAASPLPPDKLQAADVRH
jgi:hypothetical protein